MVSTWEIRGEAGVFFPGVFSRPLKKVLSLVLVLAMALSVMVMGTGAAFTDQADIQHTEAVDANVALNIIGGYPNGSFMPNDGVKRAEMTKMITVALAGGKEPVLGSGSVSFIDTANNWAVKYIEACVHHDPFPIVSGVGAGRFNPDGQVTGSQVAKMLLVALGYDPDQEGFTGTGWDMRVNTIAYEKGLYEELADINPDLALSREHAAQMIWNALNAIEVEYQYVLTSENGQLVSKKIAVDKTEIIDGTETPVDLLWDKYDAVVVKGIVNTVGQNVKGYTATVSTISGTLTGLTEDPTDLVGKAVKVLYSARDKVYGIYVDTENTLIDVTASLNDISDMAASSSTADGKIKIADVEYKTATSNERATAVCGTLGNSVASTNKLAYVFSDGAITLGSKITAIDNNGDEKIDIIVVTPIEVYKVNYVGNDVVTLIAPEEYAGPTLSAIGTADLEDIVAYDGMAQGDYVCYIPDAYTIGEGPVLAKLDVISGTVDGINTTDNETRIDGTWYNDSHLTSGVLTMGSTVSVIAVNGVLYGVVEKQGVIADNYLVLTSDAHEAYGDYTAKAMFSDGTSEVITISKLYQWDSSKSKWTYQDLSATTDVDDCTLYAYKVVDGAYQLIKVADAKTAAGTAADGTNYALEDLGYDKMDTTSVTHNNKKLGTGTAATTFTSVASIDPSALIFLHDEDGYRVVNGAYIQAWGSDEVTGLTVTALLTTTNGFDYVEVALIDMGSSASDPGASTTDKYGMIVSAVIDSNLTGDTVAEFDLFDGTTTTRVQVKDDNSMTLAKGTIIKYSEVESGVIKITSTADDTDIFQLGSTGAGRYASAAKTIVALEGKGDVGTLVKVNGDPNTYIVTEDTTVLVINASETKGVPGASISMKKNNGNADAIIVDSTKTDDDGNHKLELLVVELNNDFGTNP